MRPPSVSRAKTFWRASFRRNVVHLGPVIGLIGISQIMYIGIYIYISHKRRVTATNGLFETVVKFDDNLNANQQRATNVVSIIVFLKSRNYRCQAFGRQDKRQLGRNQAPFEPRSCRRSRFPRSGLRPAPALALSPRGRNFVPCHSRVLY